MVHVRSSSGGSDLSEELIPPLLPVREKILYLHEGPADEDSRSEGKPDPGKPPDECGSPGGFCRLSPEHN